MNSLIVKVGCHVELELSDNSGVVDRLSVDIVSDRSADFKAGFLGESTPLARTILDQPAGRTVHGAWWDSGLSRMFIFGGFSYASGNVQLEDTWSWEGTTPGWTNVSPAGHRPSARYSLASTYDANLMRGVVEGGVITGDVLVNSVHEWAG